MKWAMTFSGAGPDIGVTVSGLLKLVSDVVTVTVALAGDDAPPAPVHVTV